jgi:multidrug efflux pump
MRDRLSSIDGVSTVIIGGERRYAMRVWIDRQALAARGLTVDDIEQALRRENVELPAGRIESLNTELTGTG